MPKSKRRHRKKSTKSSRTVDWSGGTKQSSGLGGWILIGVIGAAILGGGGYIWHNAQADQAFQELAAKGKSTLGKVENLPNLGRNHLNAGQSYQYASAYPTSGPHAQFWTNPGFYARLSPPPCAFTRRNMVMSSSITTKPRLKMSRRLKNGVQFIVVIGAAFWPCLTAV